MRTNENSISIFPYSSKSHPAYKWIVHYTDIQSGLRKKSLFKERDEALNFRRVVASESAHHFSTKKMPLSDAELEEYHLLSKRAEEVGITLAEMTQFIADWTEYLSSQYDESITDAINLFIKCDIQRHRLVHLRETAEEYLTRLSTGLRSRNYIVQTRHVLKMFVEFFKDEDPLLVDITKQNILDWFEVAQNRPGKGGKPLSQVAKYNTLRCIQIFFNYCRRKELIEYNFSLDIEKPVLLKEDPKFYTVEQAELILWASKPLSSTRLLLVLGIFGGFRLSEMLRMKWKHISFEYNDVRIDGSMAKTRFRRQVRLPENARVWLEPYSHTNHDPEEFVFPWREAEKCFLYQELEVIFSSVHIPRIRNGLRHTAATYHYAMSENAVVSSDQMGNSPGVLKEHYTGLVSKSRAKAFYQILPK